MPHVIADIFAPRPKEALCKHGRLVCATCEEVAKALKAASSTPRVRALRERRTDLKRVEVYAHPDDAEAIKRYAARLARKRERAEALIAAIRGIAARSPAA